MSESSAAKLVAMANQIALNLTHDADPAMAVADHIEAFWTARMKDALIAHGDAGLEPVAYRALALLALAKSP